MVQALLWLSIAGMAALWCAAYVSSTRQSRAGVQVVFVIGTLLAWPALTLGLGGEIFDATFPAEQGKPVGPSGAIALLLAGGLASSRGSWAFGLRELLAVW
jgi:hypothetical protein